MLIDCVCLNVAMENCDLKKCLKRNNLEYRVDNTRGRLFKIELSPEQQKKLQDKFASACSCCLNNNAVTFLGRRR